MLAHKCTQVPQHNSNIFGLCLVHVCEIFHHLHFSNDMISHSNAYTKIMNIISQWCLSITFARVANISLLFLQQWTFFDIIFSTAANGTECIAFYNRLFACWSRKEMLWLFRIQFDENTIQHWLLNLMSGTNCGLFVCWFGN